MDLNAQFIAFYIIVRKYFENTSQTNWGKNQIVSAINALYENEVNKWIEK